jgi:hypothetical protein
MQHTNVLKTKFLGHAQNKTSRVFLMPITLIDYYIPNQKY